MLVVNISIGTNAAKTHARAHLGEEIRKQNIHQAISVCLLELIFSLGYRSNLFRNKLLGGNFFFIILNDYIQTLYHSEIHLGLKG